MTGRREDDADHWMRLAPSPSSAISQRPKSRAGAGYGLTMEHIEDWNGKSVAVDRTTGKTLLMCDPFDALMRGRGTWPPPALVMMLGEGESRRYPYSAELHASVSIRLGVLPSASTRSSSASADG